MKLIDILRAESKWTKKQHRKKKKRQLVSQNKWNKKLYRKYQSETGKNNLFELIPKDTPYCYRNKVCPFWYSIEVKLEDRVNHIGIVAVGQNHIGGCKLLKKTDDDMGGWGLLWDQCKECGLNYGFGDFK
jgi:hypothetical protein